MGVKEYILSEDQMERMEREARSGKKTVRRAKPAHYQALVQSGCDFIVEKQKGKRRQLLAVIVSQKQYYLEEGSTRKKLSIPLLKQFLADLEGELPLPEVSWLTGLADDEYLAHVIMTVLRRPESRSMLKTGDYYVYSRNEGIQFDSDFLPDYCNRLEKYMINIDDLSFQSRILNYLAKRRGMSKKELLRDILWRQEGKKESILLQHAGFLKTISLVYGPDWANKAMELFMDSRLESPVSEAMLEIILFGSELGEYLLTSKKTVRCFSPGNFLDYIFRESCAQGYAFDLMEFCSDWERYLSWQEELYGKIRTKYPKHLASELKKLKYELILHKNEINKKRWEKAVEGMEPYMYSNKKYKILRPETPEDIISEGQNQYNCVGGYVDKVTRGEEMILFMRKCKHEKESLITIEVFPNNMVGQIFGRYNASPSDEEMDFIREWAGEKGLILPACPMRPRAADTEPDPFENEFLFGNAV